MNAKFPGTPAELNQALIQDRANPLLNPITREPDRPLFAVSTSKDDIQRNVDIIGKGKLEYCAMLDAHRNVIGYSIRAGDLSSGRPLSRGGSTILFSE
jgi:hypothetical protein